MSVRSNGSGDTMVVTPLSAFSITTQEFSLGCWVKMMSDRDVFQDFFAFAKATLDPSSYLSVGTGDAGADSVVPFLYGDEITSGSGTVDSGQALTDETWYYILVSRVGTTIRIRVFDDSTSTTPLVDVTGTCNASLTNYEHLIMGAAFTGEWVDAEFELLKFHDGDAWSDAEARAESQSRAYVLATGTARYVWELRNIDADVEGINEAGGAGPNFANTGFVNGASSPAQLSGGDVTAPTLSNPVDTATGATTGSGSVDTDEGNGTLYFVVTTSATPPSAAQVKAGQNDGGTAAVDSGSQAVSGTGTQNISGGFTGLTAETAYFAHYMHEDAATNQSTVSSGDGFTTDAAPAGDIIGPLAGSAGLAGMISGVGLARLVQ